MSANVPHKRSQISFDRYLSGAPTSSAEAQQVQETLMWCYGRGAQLVPATVPYNKGVSSSSISYRFYVKPRYNGARHMWAVTMHGSSSTTATGTMQTPSGDVKTWVAYPDRNYNVPILYIDDTVTQSSTAQVLTLSISVTTGTVYVDSISCWEAPRANLAQNTTEHGIDKNNFRAGEPIYNATNSSLVALADRVDAAWDINKRGSLWHFCANAAADMSSATASSVYSTTSTSSSNKLVSADVPILERRQYVNGSGSYSSLATVEVRAYLETSGANTANVQVTMTNGSSVTVTRSNTSGGWTSVGTFDVEVEDENYASALQGGNWDTATITAWSTGAGTIYVGAVSIATSLT